ncbi:MAG: amidohydrolase [Candidatus Njordarchaeales archaeon]
MSVIADLIIINSRAYDPKSNEFFEGIAVRNGRIIAVGTNHEIKEYLGSQTVVIDCGKKIVIPSFIDAHTHVMGMAARAGWLDFSKVRSLREFLKIIEEYAHKIGKNEWILGYAWDESKWIDEKRYPTIKELDEVAPNNPVFLIRIDGHMAVLNSLALKNLRVPENLIGFEKDEKGNPTGRIKEQALEFARKRLETRFENILRGIKIVARKVLKLGISMVHETLSLETLISLLTAGERGQLPFTVYGFILVEYLDKLLELGIRRGFGGSRVILGGVKIFADGSIGARTAALREPYKDDPSNRGILFYSNEELIEIFRKADKAGLQMAIHAIGDRAIDQVLDCLREAKVSGALRHRIEHFEIAHEEHIKAVKSLGIVISAQPNFVSQWQMPGGMYERRLGRERWRIMNPFGKMFRENIRLAFGSDCMPLDPIYGLYGAINHPIEDNKLSAREALLAYTFGSAYAAHQEDLRGSIGVGKIANLIILSAKDLSELEKETLKVKICGMVLDGKITTMILD